MGTAEAVTVDSNDDEYTLTTISPDGKMTCFAALRGTAKEEAHYAIAIYASPEANGPSTITKIPPAQMVQILKDFDLSACCEALGVEPPTTATN